ncbi:MAG: hypothetical protein QOI60_1535 [Actinomycetota bacterium]|nr:hypothetical protein [Actinomycetota bacterium]
MAHSVQVVIDAHDPDELSGFWAAALGYVKEPPPGGFGSWEDFLRQMGVPEADWNSRGAVVDPEGVGPRLFFQMVPEPKTVKNRVHLDIRTGTGPDAEAGLRRTRIDAKVQELLALGATLFREVEEMGEYWVVLQDPEGNEFCVT